MYNKKANGHSVIPLLILRAMCALCGLGLAGTESLSKSKGCSLFDRKVSWWTFSNSNIYSKANFIWILMNGCTKATLFSTKSGIDPFSWYKGTGTCWLMLIWKGFSILPFTFYGMTVIELMCCHGGYNHQKIGLLEHSCISISLYEGKRARFSLSIEIRSFSRIRDQDLWVRFKLVWSWMKSFLKIDFVSCLTKTITNCWTADMTAPDLFSIGFECLPKYYWNHSGVTGERRSDCIAFQCCDLSRRWRAHTYSWPFEDQIS